MQYVIAVTIAVVALRVYLQWWTRRRGVVAKCRHQPKLVCDGEDLDCETCPHGANYPDDLHRDDVDCSVGRPDLHIELRRDAVAAGRR